jgi:hypothetical protein
VSGAEAPQGAPADAEYSALCVRLAELQKEAGAFLARSLRADLTMPQRQSADRIARDFAAEALEVGERMTAWRLAHGWPR